MQINFSKTKMLNSRWLRKLIGTALVIGASFLPTKIIAQENNQQQNCPATARFSADVNSKYLLRAIPLSDKFVIQPYLTLTKGAYTSSVFGVIDPNDKDANESDILVDYTKALNSKANLSVGYSYINFPDIGEKTQEAYFGISFPNTRLKPSIFLYRDFDFLNGTYVEATASNDFKLGIIDLETKLLVAYNQDYFRNGSGLSHLNASVNLPLRLNKRITLNGRINLIKALNKDFKDNVVYGTGVNIEL